MLVRANSRSLRPSERRDFLGFHLLAKKPAQSFLPDPLAGFPPFFWIGCRIFQNFLLCVGWRVLRNWRASDRGKC
jgi:hypothetical protein